MTSNESDVSRFYANKNIFITGGTGFLGIALIEKILRSVPNVNKLLLLNHFYSVFELIYL